MYGKNLFTLIDTFLGENNLPWPSLMPRAKQIGPLEVGRDTLSLNLYHPQLLSNWYDAFFRKLGYALV